jgi:hypothetical protein
MNPVSHRPVVTWRRPETEDYCAQECPVCSSFLMFAPRYSRPCLLNAVLCAMSGFLREIATGAKSYRARVMRKVSLQVDAKKEVIDLSGFKDALSETARQFASRAQQDAQEFFTAVLEALSSETLRAARTSGGPEHVVWGLGMCVSSVGDRAIPGSFFVCAGRRCRRCRSCGARDTPTGLLRRHGARVHL